MCLGRGLAFTVSQKNSIPPALSTLGASGPPWSLANDLGAASLSCSRSPALGTAGLWEGPTGPRVPPAEVSTLPGVWGHQVREHSG